MLKLQNSGLSTVKWGLLYQNTCVVIYNKQLFIATFFFIKITGKVYRWFFKTRKIRLRVNHAHLTVMYFKKHFSKLWLQKYYTTLLAHKPIKQTRFNTLVSKVRWPNIFTGRGVDILNHFRYKKLGKISAYMLC